MSDTGKSKRHWSQFSIRSLLALMVVCAIAFGWLGQRFTRARLRRQRAEQQARIVAKMECLRPHATYSSKSGNVVSLFLDPAPNGREIGDELKHLKHLPELRTLGLPRTKVADDALRHLKNLNTLRFLNLEGTNVSDAGLAYLAGLEGLESLDLQRTKITDAGLTHLRGLKSLRVLELINTRITDAGLVHLHELPSLFLVTLTDTDVTERGVEELERRFPNTDVNWGPPRDPGFYPGGGRFRGGTKEESKK